MMLIDKFTINPQGPGCTRAKKFHKLQILAVVALDQHVLTKTSLIDSKSTDNKTSHALIVQWISLHCMFLTLRSPATRDFWPSIGRAIFAWLAGVCVVACTTCNQRRLSC